MRLFDVKRLGGIVHETRRGAPAEVVAIIPLYNYGHTIVEALESVVDQEIPQVSVVVVNDCSADDGEEKAIAGRLRPSLARPRRRRRSRR